MAKFPIPENCSAYVPMILKEFCFSKINGCKLTFLDHIYTRHLNAQQAGVVPIYYSYHMTYISVDMQQL
jgi:hypothetical protein